MRIPDSSRTSRGSENGQPPTFEAIPWRKRVGASSCRIAGTFTKLPFVNASAQLRTSFRAADALAAAVGTNVELRMRAFRSHRNCCYEDRLRLRKVAAS